MSRKNVSAQNHQSGVFDVDVLKQANSVIDKDSLHEAARLMEDNCPIPIERYQVLKLLLRSIELVENLTSTAWSLTLFVDGFRLNVGVVEVMTFKRVPLSFPFEGRPESLFEFRFLLFDQVPSQIIKFEDGQVDEQFALIPSHYKSVGQPQYVFIGLVNCESADAEESLRQWKSFRVQSELIFEAHSAFVREAAHSRSGKIRTGSPHQRSHSVGLVIYAKQYCANEVPGEAFGNAETNYEVFDVQEKNEIFFEGKLITTTLNRYERNLQSRERCLGHHGRQCCVCGFSFLKMYGEVAEKYIHVHHLTPVATIGKEYEIDPVADLRPVCANCHSVIHLRQPPFTIAEMQKLVFKE